MDAIYQQYSFKFSGMNNVDDPTRLFPHPVEHTMVFPLWKAKNVMIDNSYQIVSRPGKELLMAGKDLHSLWSDNDQCFLVSDVVLYRLNEDMSTTWIRAGLSQGLRMSYAAFNDRVYYTNGQQIGYVKGITDYAVMDPVMNFKMPLPPGEHIEEFMACLFVAAGNILYISDPLCDFFDIRYGYRIFPYPIRMLRAVDNGLYISDKRIHFLHGKSNEDFERDTVYAHPAIPYTDIRVPAQYLDSDEKGNVAIWTGENGICVGNNSGNVINLTDRVYHFAQHNQGAAMIRDKDNLRHYINSLF